MCNGKFVRGEDGCERRKNASLSHSRRNSHTRTVEDLSRSRSGIVTPRLKISRSPWHGHPTSSSASTPLSLLDSSILTPLAARGTRHTRLLSLTPRR